MSLIASPYINRIVKHVIISVFFQSGIELSALCGPRKVSNTVFVSMKEFPKGPGLNIISGSLSLVSVSGCSNLRSGQYLLLFHVDLLLLCSLKCWIICAIGPLTTLATNGTMWLGTHSFPTPDSVCGRGNFVHIKVKLPLSGSQNGGRNRVFIILFW